MADFDLDKALDFVAAGAEHYGIDKDLAFSLFEKESSWNPNARGSSGELGIAQLMPETAKGLGVDPTDTWQNIDGGLRYLKQKLDEHKDPALAVAAYNAGSGAVKKAGGIPQNDITPKHVANVMDRYNEIKAQRGEQVPAPAAPQAPRAGIPEGIAGELSSYGLVGPGKVATGVPAMYGGAELPQLTGTAPREGPWNPDVLTPALQSAWHSGSAALVKPFAEGRLGKILASAAAPEQGLAPSDLPPPTRNIFDISYDREKKLAEEAEAKIQGAPWYQTIVPRVVGGAAPGIAHYVAGVPFAAIDGMTEGYEKGALGGYVKPGVGGAIIGALENAARRFAIGKAFKYVTPEKGGLDKPLTAVGLSITPETLWREFSRQMGGAASIGMMDALSRGAPLPEALQSAAEMVILAASTGTPTPRRMEKGTDVAGQKSLSEIGAKAYKEIEEYFKPLGEKILRDDPQRVIELREEDRISVISPPASVEGIRAPAPLILETPRPTTTPVEVLRTQGKLREAQALRGELGPREEPPILPQPQVPPEFVLTETGTGAPITPPAPLEARAPVPPVITPEAQTSVAKSPMQIQAEAKSAERRAAIEKALSVEKDTEAKIKGTARYYREKYGLDYTPYQKDNGKWGLRGYVNPIAKANEEIALKNELSAPEDIPKAEKTFEEEFETPAAPVSNAILAEQAKLRGDMGEYRRLMRLKEVPLEEQSEAEYKNWVQAQRKKSEGVPSEKVEEYPLLGYGPDRDNGFTTGIQALLYKTKRGELGTIEPKDGKFWIARGKKPDTYFSLGPQIFSKEAERWFSRTDRALVADSKNWPKFLGLDDLKKRFDSLTKNKDWDKRFKKEEWEDRNRLLGLEQRLRDLERINGGKLSKEKMLEEIVASQIQVEEVVRKGKDAKYPTEWQLPEGENYVELVLTSPQAMELGGDKGHYEEGKGLRNVGWIRGKEYTAADGKRYFHIDEIQDKRHSDARIARQEEVKRLMAPVETGMMKPEIRKRVQEIENEVVALSEIPNGSPRYTESLVRRRELGKERTRLEKEPENYIQTPGLSRSEAEAKVGEGFGYDEGIPDAPFRKTWQTLNIKAALKWAAERGLDGVTWSTGEQVAERYNKGLRDITGAQELGDGTITLRARGNTRSIRSDSLEAAELRQLLGDRASQLPQGIDLSSNPLSIGGQGFKKLYGSMEGKRETQEEFLKRVDEAKREYWKAETAYQDFISKTPRDVDEYKNSDVRLDRGRLDIARRELADKIENMQAQVTDTTWTPGIVSSAMRDALEPFRVKEEMVRAGVDQWTQSEPGGPVGKVGIREVTEPSPSEWSVQPGITFTPEMKDHYLTNPMALYSMNPMIFLRPKNIKELKREVIKDMKPNEIARLYASEDITGLTKVAALVQWIVQDNKRLEPFLNAVNKADELVQRRLFKSLAWSDNYKDLDKGGQRNVTRLLVGLDGKTYEGLGITEPKFNKIANEDVQLNSKHYDQYLDAITKRGLSAEEASIATEMRMAMDQALADKWNQGRQYYRKGTEGFAALQNEIFEIPNYLPHNRKGSMALEGWIKDADGNWKKMVDYAFDPPATLFTAQKKVGQWTGEEQKWIEGYAKKKFEQRMAEDPFLQGKDVRWSVSRRPADAIQLYGRQPILVMALNDVLGKIKENVPSDFHAAFDKALSKEAQQALQKRGEWGHWARREGVHGYDIEDAGKIWYDYMQGFHHILGKAEKTKMLSELVKEVDLDRPNEVKWVANYIESMLKPESNVSDALYKLRTLAYLKYINPVKFFFVNLTNAITAGAPVLMTHGVGGADLYLMKNMGKTAAWMAGKAKLTPDRQRLMKELYEEGPLRAKFLEAVGRELEQSPASWAKGLIAKGFDKYTWPASASETMSRAATALAAYDAFLDGKISRPITLEKYKMGNEKIKTPNEEQFQTAKAFVEEVVNQSHSIFGEANRPEWARMGAAGKVAGSTLIFKHYAQHVYHMWRWMAGQGGMGKAALARSLMAQVALGGLQAFPLAASMNKLYQWLLGGDSMWTDIKEKVGKAGDWLNHGVPAMLGLNVSNSFDMDVPWVAEDLFGVPGSIVRDLATASTSAKNHEWMRALEYALPLKTARDLLVQRRLGEEGFTSPTGKAINWPASVIAQRPDLAEQNSSKPYRLNALDRTKQTLGFTPLDISNLRDARESIKDITEYRTNKENELVTRYVNAWRRGDDLEREAVLTEAHEWNTKWMQKGKPELVLRLRDAIKARIKPIKPARVMRGKARETMEAWGQ